jgi:hypothetical protein
MSEEVAARVDLDLEARLLEPCRREPVRLVLGLRRVRPIRARTAADRVQLLEPVEDAHAAERRASTPLPSST